MDEVGRSRCGSCLSPVLSKHSPGEDEPLATTTDVSPAPTSAPARPKRDLGARLLRWFGIACLLAASGIGGFITWTLWGTGLQTARAQEQLRGTFERQVQEAQARPGDPALERPILRGDAYAEIQIPSINIDFIVVQGTGVEDLKKGPGHYVQTADPWDETGRVGIAGHRTTYLHPFQQLDEVKEGDTIYLRTTRGDFKYRVSRVFVIPSEGSGRVLKQTDEPTLVLTTCNPEYSATERLIVVADREDPAAA